MSPRHDDLWILFQRLIENALPGHFVISIALKRLLRQLFTSDSELFDIHALAQHILTSAGQMGIGTTVKVDGTESDPYAYISLVDLSNVEVSPSSKSCLALLDYELLLISFSSPYLQAKPAVKPLVEYLISRLPTSSPFRDLLVSTSSPQSKNRIALVVSERLVNLPIQIMPPLWRMTIDEVEKARSEVSRVRVVPAKLLESSNADSPSPVSPSREPPEWTLLTTC